MDVDDTFDRQAVAAEMIQHHYSRLPGPPAPKSPIANNFVMNLVLMPTGEQGKGFDKLPEFGNLALEAGSLEIIVFV